MFQKILNQKVKHQVGFLNQQKQEDMNRRVVKEYKVVDKKIKTLHEVFNWKAHLKMNQFVKQSFRKIRMKLLHPSILIILRINQNKYNNLQQKNWRINNSPIKNNTISVSMPTFHESYNYSNFTQINLKVIGSESFGVVHEEKLEQQKIIQDIRYKNRKSQILQELDHINVLKMKHVFFTHDENKDKKKKLSQFYYTFLTKLYSFKKSSIRDFKQMPDIQVKLFSYYFSRLNG
ncbi:unnamed protein product [Paramecium primaurelia]|uniref:Protein kinase domain-containing protein n=1 Tax=Paramecium primaurelia TaxID=5886 RepID=A0A8S1KVY4_PARPR|nr:unnamed protein product [Paramecium primaurelia]